MAKQIYPSLQSLLAELEESCLLLARHGETDWNAANIVQGQQDRPLSRKGYEQRKNLFYLLRPISLKRIVCSTLQRTIETAMPLSLEKGIAIEQRHELDEVRLGVFEGQHKEEFSDEFSRSCYRCFLEDEINIALPGGGESLRMVDKRVRKAVGSFMGGLRESGHSLVVGHRNVNKMIVKSLLGLSFEEGYRVEHRNACLYIFAPGRAEMFMMEVPSPQEPTEVRCGYERSG